MFKSYKRQRVAGPEAAYWEGAFGAFDLKAARRACEASPLWPLMEASLEPDRLFLDGGCGAGQWVKYYHARGYRAAGVDFAEGLIENIRTSDPTLDVRFGDVRSLPFDDGEVHTYYSGGVAEHFEAGPEPVLAEARRVLAPDGLFLCSVPDSSRFRRWALYRAFGRRLLGPEHHIEAVSGVGLSPAPDGFTFHQYVFSESEFRAHLEASGFRVVRSFGFSFMWALFEVQGTKTVHDAAVDVAKRAGAFARRAAAKASKPGADEFAGPEGRLKPGQGSADRADGARGPAGWPARFVVWEDDSLPILGSAVRALRENVAHMRMFVCRVAQ